VNKFVMAEAAKTGKKFNKFKCRVRANKISIRAYVSDNGDYLIS